MKNAKQKEYYINYLKKREEAKIKSLEKLKNGQINLSKLDTAMLLWFVRDLKIFIVKYSLGYAKEVLKTEFIDLLNNMENAWKPKEVKLKDGNGNEFDKYIIDSCIYMRWLLSLGILLDIPYNTFNILVNLVKRDNIKDKLYDFLIASRVEGWQMSEDLSIIKPENRIKDIISIEDKTKCEAELKVYLKREWYKTYRYFGFYNTHKKPDDMLLFYGYWAFEVAAIVKIKGLDDSSFRDNPYYPQDLANI